MERLSWRAIGQSYQRSRQCCSVLFSCCIVCKGWGAPLWVLSFYQAGQDDHQGGGVTQQSAVALHVVSLGLTVQDGFITAVFLAWHASSGACMVVAIYAFWGGIFLSQLDSRHNSSI